MPIVVEHQPPARVIAGASYAAGLGQFLERRRQERVQQQAALQDVAAQAALQEQRLQAQVAMQRMAMVEQYQRAIEARKWAERDMTQEQTNALERIGLSKAADLLELQERQREEERRARTDPRVQQQLANLKEYERNVLLDQTLRPQDRKAALQNIEDRRKAIIQTAAMGEESQFPEGQDVGDVWTATSGAELTRDEKGIPHVLVRPDQMPSAEADRVKIQQEIDKHNAAVDKDVADMAQKMWEADVKATLPNQPRPEPGPKYLDAAKSFNAWRYRNLPTPAAFAGGAATAQKPDVFAGATATAQPDPFARVIGHAPTVEPAPTPAAPAPVSAPPPQAQFPLETQTLPPAGEVGQELTPPPVAGAQPLSPVVLQHPAFRALEGESWAIPILRELNQGKTLDQIGNLLDALTDEQLTRLRRAVHEAMAAQR